MAKKKKEKIVDLKPEKITQEQLERLQNYINDINQTQMQLGNIEVRKHELLHGIAGYRDELSLMQSEFEKDYGTFDVDIKTGVINYPKENGEADKKN